MTNNELVKFNNRCKWIMKYYDTSVNTRILYIKVYKSLFVISVCKAGKYFLVYLYIKKVFNMRKPAFLSYVDKKIFSEYCMCYDRKRG